MMFECPACGDDYDTAKQATKCAQKDAKEFGLELNERGEYVYAEDNFDGDDGSIEEI